MTSNNIIAIEEIKFRKDLYPRIETDPLTVQKYAEDLEVLPPIEINQNHELIDGWHRWTAHKKEKAETIRCIITETKNEAEFLELAIERNATHGLQLSQRDKEKMTGRLYSAFLRDNPTKEQCTAYKERLATKVLKCGSRSIERWTARDDKDHEQDLQEIAFTAWLANSTQEQIAELTGWDQTKVSKFMISRQMAKNHKPIANYAETDEQGNLRFQIPIYNVWKRQEKSNGSKHPGNTESKWLDNLLYLYTQPFDLIVDPFAGGGSTIDVCRRRFRRYWVSDRKPVEEREQDIRQHDLTEGLPAIHNWKDVRLVYLDPPYWAQAKGKYGDDPTDLSNMDLEAFNGSLSGIIKAFAKKLSDAYIALVIQPTQWNTPGRQFTDHVGDMLQLVKLPVDMRFSVPYESQQCTPQMVDWAKTNRRCLVLTREIIVWKVNG
jgi:hypothetical protein